MTSDLAQEFRAAVEAEKAAWANLRGHLPGSPEFDPALWAEWQRAVQLADVARQQARQTPAASGRGAGRAMPLMRRLFSRHQV